MSENCPECRRPSVSPLEMMTDEQWEAGPDSVCHARSTLHRPQDASHKCLELTVARLTAELAEARKPRWCRLGDGAVLAGVDGLLARVEAVDEPGVNGVFCNDFDVWLSNRHGERCCLPGYNNRRLRVATLAEAKAAAEKAIGETP